jgi:predicted phage tail protein
MESTLKKIYLHGALAEQFGNVFELVVSDALEAVRALCHMVPGFRKEFENYDFHVVKGELNRGWCLDEDTVKMQIAGDELHFVPVIAGSGGKKGLGKIIGGIILIGLAFTGVGAALGAAIGLTTTKMAIMGGLLILGGIAQGQAKTPTMQFSSMEPAETRASAIWNGPENTTEQGNAIPLIYGRVRVGSQVISSGQDTEQL